MNLIWIDGRKMTEQEEKAMWEALFPHSADDMSESDIQYEIDHDVISLSTCRNGRDVVWVQTNDTAFAAVYVDTLEELSNEEIEKELL